MLRVVVLCHFAYTLFLQLLNNYYGAFNYAGRYKEKEMNALGGRFARWQDASVRKIAVKE